MYGLPVDFEGWPANPGKWTLESAVHNWEYYGNELPISGDYSKVKHG